MSRNNPFAAIVLVAAFIGLSVVAPPASVYAAANDEVFSAGEPGDVQTSTRVASVMIRDADGTLSFDPAVVKVRLGEQIRFVVTNAGLLDHEFFLGSPEEISEHKDMMKKMSGMEHKDANVIRLKPGETKEIVWHFTKPGNFEYACLLPGHLEAGMFGKIIVE